MLGIDISEKALSYAIANKRLNSVSNVYFCLGDMFKPFRRKSFIAITANPPYVKRNEIPTLEPEVRDYEPLEALDGGDDGLLFYRRILTEAADYLISSGLLFFELGINQASEVEQLAFDKGFKVIEIIKDLAGIERVMILKKCEL